MIEKTSTPTIVIVYGAFADSSQWLDLIKRLLTGDRKPNAVAVVAAFAPEDGLSAASLNDRTVAPHLHRSRTQHSGSCEDRLREAVEHELQLAPENAQPAFLTAEQVLIEPLTAREQDVLQVLAGGASNQEIAETLVIAPNTVKRHVQTILGKLGARNRTQAVARAQQFDLIERR